MEGKAGGFLMYVGRKWLGRRGVDYFDFFDF